MNMKTKAKICSFAFLTIMLGLLMSNAVVAKIITYNVDIDTSTINGTAGRLDFNFAPSAFGSQAATVTISNFNSDGLVGGATPSGDVIGSLPPSVTINDTSGNPLPGNDYLTLFTYRNSLKFDLIFSGPAIDTPDGMSDPSTFFFSMLDNADTPVLSKTDPNINPGGFAFMVDLNNDGSTTPTNFMTSGTVALGPLRPPGPAPAPEPATLGLVAVGLAAMGGFRIRRRP